MKQIILSITAALLTLRLSQAGNAQQMAGSADADIPMTKAEREQIITALVKQLNDNYVFPDVANGREETA